MHVALSLPADDASPWMELFARALPEAAFERHEPDRTPAARAPADYVIAGHPSRTLFVEQPAPRAIFTLSAGVQHVLALPNLPPGVALVRVEDAGMSAQMVRYALTAAMRVAQRLDTYRRQQQAARWEQHPPRSPGQVAVGVMGLGVIGGAIARALAAQGFAVRGFALRPKDIAGVRCHAGAGAFAGFLSGLDVVINVLPATADTDRLLDREALLRLADGAHVVNMGRANVLVEDDLLSLLDAGKLAGATLDVFRDEPLPPAHPLWRRCDVTVTPHVAGLTLPDETVAQVADKIRALERGERITGVVDRGRGY